MGIRFNMAANQSAVPPQSGEGNPSNRPNPRAQQTSMDFGAAGANTMGAYQYDPSANQGNDPASSNMLFAGNDAISMQQFAQNRALYQGPEGFNLDTAFDPSSFASAVDPMNTFQQTYPPAGSTYTGNDLTYALSSYDTSAAAAPSQSLDMLFPNPTYVSLPQSSMQPPTTSGQLTSLDQQQNWADLSNFTLSLPGTNLQNASPVANSPSELTLVALPRRTSAASQSHPITSYIPGPPMTTTASSSPAFRNPFAIPSGEFQSLDLLIRNYHGWMDFDADCLLLEIAASTTPKTGIAKVTSGYYNIYSSSGFDMFGILVCPWLS